MNTSTELDVLARDAVIAVPRKSRHWQTPAWNTFYKANWVDGKIIIKPVIAAIAVIKYNQVIMVAKQDSKYVIPKAGNVPPLGRFKY